MPEVMARCSVRVLPSLCEEYIGRGGIESQQQYASRPCPCFSRTAIQGRPGEFSVGLVCLCPLSLRWRPEPTYYSD